MGSNPTSKGTLPAAHQAIPTLERQAGTQAQAQVPGFAQAFSDVALTQTALGDVASKVVSSTGMKLGEIQGAALAEKNPNIPHLLPSLTKSDEAFANAYSSRSQQILGQQVSSLINQSEEEAASAGELSEGVIGSFQQSAAKGVDDVLKNAPDTIRDQMMYTYQNQVNDSAHRMRMKMISDQHTKQKQIQQVHNDSQVSGAFEAGFSNGADAGKTSLDLFTQDLERQKSAGTLTPKEYETLKDSATLNLYAGIYSRGVRDARANEKLPEAERSKEIPTVGEYLSNIHDSLPKDMAEIEKSSIVKNVVEYAKEAHAAEAQSNQLTSSRLDRALADGTVDRPMIAQAEQDLPPAEFNKFMAKYWTNRSKKDEENNKVRGIANNFNDPSAANLGTPSEVNKAFNALVNKSMSDNPNQDPMAVKVGIAKSGGVEVPSFVNELNVMLTRGTPDQAYSAMRAYDEVRDYNPQNVRSVSKQAQAMGAMMNDLHEVAGYPLQDAWTQAKESIFNQTPEQLDIRDLQYKEYAKNSLPTSVEIISKAQNLLDVPYFTNVPNLPYVSNSIMRLHKDYFMMTGSEAAADKLTKNALQKSYGTTHANGSKQKVFMPIEKLAGIGTDAPEVVHADMEDNISAQLQATKDAYDKGNIDWYYEVGDRVKGNVMVNRVYRTGKSEPLNVSISASNNLQRTQNSSSPYAGYYDISLIDANGFPAPLSVVSNGPVHQFAYRPNLERIKAMYTYKHNKGMTNQEMEKSVIRKFIDDHAAHEAHKAKFTRTPFGQFLLRDM